ncbi:unnamed protein product, partial [Scytosiphon promiscuus]
APAAAAGGSRGEQGGGGGVATQSADPGLALEMPLPPVPPQFANLEPASSAGANDVATWDVLRKQGYTSLLERLRNGNQQPAVPATTGPPTPLAPANGTAIDIDIGEVGKCQGQGQGQEAAHETMGAPGSKSEGSDGRGGDGSNGASGSGSNNVSVAS